MKDYNVWLNIVMGPNPRNGKTVMESFSSRQEIYENRMHLKDFEIFSASQVKRAENTGIEDTDGIRLVHREENINSISCFEQGYPPQLKEIHDLPPVLFYKGDLSILDSGFTVGIIGSRHCTGEGEGAAKMISGEIARSGGVVISGLAQGIDTIAHRSCVENGGKTVAVTGVPLNQYFPKINKDFQKNLEKEHLVLCEYPAGLKYHSSHFVQRNRIIAALSRALCVVQAKKRSGSIATVNRRVEYNKPVFAVPGSIFDPAYEGTNRLLAKNVATAVIDGAGIIGFLTGKTGADKKGKTQKATLPPVSENAMAVFKVIKGAMFTPAVIQASQLPVALVKAALTELEIYGYVTRAATGEYIRNGD